VPGPTAAIGRRTPRLRRRGQRHADHRGAGRHRPLFGAAPLTVRA